MSLPNKNSYSNLGGTLVDYSAPTDFTTDLPASCDDEARSDVAAMTRTAIRAWVRFSVISGVCTVDSNGWDGVYGVSVSSYKPSIAYGTVGTYNVTFPSTVVDARGIAYALNLQDGWCNFKSTDTGFGYFTPFANVTGPNTVTVTLWDTSAPSLVDPQAGDASEARITLYVL